MPDANKKKRKWAGLVCPVCRFVFRVPKNHDGSGVVCPACHYLLNIPGAEADKTAERIPAQDAPKSLAPKPRDKKTNKPIVSRPLSEKDTLPQSEKSGHGTSSGSGSGTKRVRRRKQKSKDTHEWESKPSRAASEPDNPMAWIVGGTLLGLTVVGIGTWLVLDSIGDGNKSDDNSGDGSTAGIVKPMEVKKVELTEEEKRRQQEIADSVKTGMNVLTDAEVVVRKFLTAEKLSDLESLVRTPEVTVPRMKAWYTENKWSPPGAKDVGYGGRVTVKGVMASMAVRLDDYSVRQIALENTADGYKVDWESWVAWSSMPWPQLFEKLPTEPVEVRVHCSLDTYYNRLFSDDSKWVAVRLESPQSERAIYGYIDKGTPSLMRMLGDLRNRGTFAATITIRYPEDSIAKNQVEIVEFLQSGWVRPSEKESEPEDTPAE